jgi:hypothetical protein
VFEKPILNISTRNELESEIQELRQHNEELKSELE